jgi:hypothetical protein
VKPSRSAPPSVMAQGSASVRASLLSVTLSY